MVAMLTCLLGIRLFCFVMFVQFFHRCWLTLTFLLFTAAPLWAEGAAEGAEIKVWVIQYAIMVGFLSLALFILLRPTKRKESAFTFDELQAKKEEEMKKLKGTH